MLGKAEYNLRKSALKRQYQQALANADITGLAANPHIVDAVQKMEARKALRGQGAYAPAMYTGGGGYLKDFGGAIGRDIGGALGYKHIGGSVGRALGSRLGKLTGMGAYEANFNQLFPSQGGAPMMVSGISGEFGGMCIDHTEFVANIYGNTADFSNQTFAINPGLESAFPWLSQIACNFEEYRLEQLVYEFQAVVTDQGTSNTGQVGTLIIATQYNASSTKFNDIQSMLQYDGVQTSMITKDFIHGVECDSSQRAGDLHLYIRSNPVVSGEDIKLYDHGILNIAQQGLPSNLNNQLIGRLFVKYRVQLMKPRFYSGRGLDISKDIFRSSGTVTRDTWLGTIAKGQQNSIGCKVEKHSARRYDITLPATWSGTLKLMVLQDPVSTPLTSDISVVLSGNGLSTIKDLYGGGDNSGVASSGFAGTNGGALGFYLEHIRVVPASGGVNNVIQITGCNAATDIAMVDCYIELCEYNAGTNLTTTGGIGPPIWVDYLNPNVVIADPTV